MLTGQNHSRRPTHCLGDHQLRLGPRETHGNSPISETLHHQREEG